MATTTTGASTPATARPKRGYSRDFTAHKNAKRRGFYIDKIPAPLHEAIMRRAKREGVSIRSLVLSYLAEWSA